MTQAPPSLRGVPRARLEELLQTTTDLDELEALVMALEVEYAVDDYETWLLAHFRRFCKAPFAPFHRRFWEWVWALEAGKRSRPQLNVWARGAAKSTSIQLGAVAAGHRRSRRYVLYVHRVQDKANDCVGSIGTMLGSESLAAQDPELCSRAVTEYGTQRGWKRNRLHTAAGFVVDALGLDSAARGAKVDDQRPDLIILDDIDSARDSPGVVQGMVTTITRDILPAGSLDCSVVYVQNLVNPDGVVAQIIDGRAEMLADADINGPIPAIEGSFAIVRNPEYSRDNELADPHFETQQARPYLIHGGTYTWAGQGRDECERFVATYGPSAFRIEALHEPRRAIGGMYDDVLEDIAQIPRSEVPDLVEKTIWLDPAVTDTDHSDSQGCQCDGIDDRGVIYRLRSWEQRSSPGVALRKALLWAYEENVNHVGIEMNVGADMSGRGIEESWTRAFDQAIDAFLAQVERDHDTTHPWLHRDPPWLEKQIATSSIGAKADRSQAMHADYERPGAIIHVVDPTEPYHEVLEAALARAFVVKPFDLADAAFWSWRWLRRWDEQAAPDSNLSVLAGLYGSVR